MPSDLEDGNGNDSIFLNAAPYDDDDSDSISLTSTLATEEEAGDIYIVEQVLAERWFEDEHVMKYLVKWEGYPIERASWEPIEMFDDKNTVNEFKKEMAFDWRQWERDREQDRVEQEKRKERRELKRERLGLISPGPVRKPTRRTSSSRNSPADLEGFIIDDEDDGEWESSDSDAPIARKRKRHPPPSAQDEEEKDYYTSTSTDSLLSELATKAKRVKTKQKLRKPGGGGGGGAGGSGDRPVVKGRIPQKRQNSSSPKSGTSKTARTAQESSRADVHRRGDSTKSYLQPLRSGPSKRRKITLPPRPKEPSRNTKPAPPTTTLTSKPKESSKSMKPAPSIPKPVPPVPKSGGLSLSYVNKMWKKSRDEPAPNINQLVLFQAGKVNRKPSGGTPDRELSSPPPSPPPVATSSPEQPTTTTESHCGIPPEVKPTLQTAPSPPKIPTKRKIYRLDQFVPSKRPVVEKVETRSDIGNEGYLTTLHGGGGGGGDGPAYDNKFGVHQVPTGPRASFVGDNRPPLSLEPHTFQCELVWGAAGAMISSVGHVTFTGFSSHFLRVLEELDITRLWISHFAEDSYIENTFVTDLGPPDEHASIGADFDKFPSFMKVFARGAGFIIHDEFTIIVYPTENTVLRSCLKVTRPHKTPLSAAVFPPLDYPVPTADVKENTEGTLTEENNGFYIHILLRDLLGVNCNEILQVSEQNPNGTYNFVLYCPEIAEHEKLEMEMALRFSGKECWDIDDIPKKISRTKDRVKVCILVHFSLKRQLHLLPNIRFLVGRDHPFYFFGHRFEIDGGRLETGTTRFWNFGTLILVTPEFAIMNQKALERVLHYQRYKAASTRICIPDFFYSRVESHALANLENPVSSELLTSMYSFQDKEGRGELIVLPVTLHQNCDEFETIVDCFTCYALEKCTEYRRFMVAHSSIDTAMVEVYRCIEFNDTSSIFDALPARPNLK